MGNLYQLEKTNPSPDEYDRLKTIFSHLGAVSLHSMADTFCGQQPLTFLSDFVSLTLKRSFTNEFANATGIPVEDNFPFSSYHIHPSFAVPEGYLRESACLDASYYVFNSIPFDGANNDQQFDGT